VDFDAAVAELGTLVETLEREGDDRALLLLQLVDAIHRPALERIVAGELEHPLARTLLAMYDLADVEPEILVEEALDAVRPYIESHGGHVELLRVDGGAVHLRLGGACDGCAGSAMTLTRGIEQALREHFPGFKRIVSHAPEPELLQIEVLRRPVFADVVALDELAPGQMRVADADGTTVLLANVDGEVYAVLDGCPVDGRTLEGGRLAGSVIVCPWHNCAYDVRSGNRADDEPGGDLPVVPVAIHDRTVKVAVNVA
jgi:Fe-S cluster biogenesis protein NfuA/nitrite reductase/ring-hydroxylating ferredoxin subunit